MHSSCLSLLVVLPGLVAGFSLSSRPAFLVQQQQSFHHPITSSTALHVSFANDLTSSGFEEYEPSGNNQNAAQPPPSTTSTFPECLVLSWECDVAEQIRNEVQRRDGPRSDAVSHQPYMVGVVGIPGSGKSTSCSVLVQDLTSSHHQVGSMLMPFDGYHYEVASLLEFDNPDDAIYRRGAPDTFNVDALKKDLERIRFGDDVAVHVPGFDHARGDPEPNAHTFNRSLHNVVVVEGLYLLHDQDGWDEVKNFFDMTIFVDADVDLCVDRLKERNKCIPGYTPEEIELRCDVVDRANAMSVEKSRQYADLIVQGIATVQR